MNKLAEVIAFGAWEGILKTLQGKYFKSNGSYKHYFYFPLKNIKTPKEISFENDIILHNYTSFKDIKLRVIVYKDDVFNPTKISTCIALKDLYPDYIEISKEEFDRITDKIQKKIDEFS